VFANFFIKFAKEDPTNVLLVCVLVLALGRLLAMMTTSLAVVYIVMSGVIVALGIMNTAISSACSSLADVGQTGGLFGVLEVNSF
jgi:diacylglycerol kinase